MADVTAQRLPILTLLILTTLSKHADCRSGFSNQVRDSALYSESLA